MTDHPTASDFGVHRAVTTRWSDNDMYGHLNNAVYYQLFDSAINGWIIDDTGFDPLTTPAIGVVAESGCRFHSQLQFPQQLDVGIRVERLGRTSVVYDLALFAHDQPEGTPVAAQGRWVHVYIDRHTQRPTDIPEAVRSLLTAHTK